MRIAYIAPYQGPTLLRNRPTLLNLSLAGNVKIELIAELLVRRGHQVEVFSQGEVVENQVKFFPRLNEMDAFHAQVRVSYASALPIRRINGLWSSVRTRALFDARHRVAPFDAVIIYNLKAPQILCANHALRRLALPVILEYEDDAAVDVWGQRENAGGLRWYIGSVRQILNSVSGCVGVSPHLLSLVPDGIPKLLLRGVVGEQYRQIGRIPTEARKNWIAFSGTHSSGKGLQPLIEAWKTLSLPGWELHIAGHGSETAALQQSAKGCGTIHFRGVLNREENAEFLSQAKIGINPHDLSSTPGNVFAFKIIEYLAAGNHVVTTPMGPLEADLEAGITYMRDNRRETIATTLTRVIQEQDYARKADLVANQRYGPAGVSQALDELLSEVGKARSSRNTGAVVSSILSSS